jgi:ABC-2 type transport system permease protein
VLRLFSTIQKEIIILLRDKGGLAIMFLMPMAMITIMALIQDAPFRDYQELKIPLILVNNDSGSLGSTIEKGLKQSKIFEITYSHDDQQELKRKVKAGDYEIAILIPANSGELLEQKVEAFVAEKLSDSGLADSAKKTSSAPLARPDLFIIFAPDTKKSFKASVLSSLRQSSSALEAKTLLHYFSKGLNENGGEMNDSSAMDGLVGFNEISTIDNPKEALLMNSVQHNVPAWTIFGMFFIVISLSGSIIKERDDGSYMRIRTMPGSYLTVLYGKLSAYLLVCMCQCFLMLLVGLYLLPLMGLPKLIIGDNLAVIALVAFFCGLAATGYGVLVGTLFNTHQQSSTFGAVSVVILAALGGIWVPVYVMPEAIRTLAELSPLYWGLDAFHKIFLNGGGISAVFPHILKLMVFFMITIGIAFFADKAKHR